MASVPMLAPVDVIPAEHVHDVLAAMRQELADLEADLLRAQHEADEAERRVLADGMSPEVTALATERVQRFLDEVEAANDRSFASALADARLTAERLIVEARAEAEASLAEGRAALGRAAVTGVLTPIETTAVTAPVPIVAAPLPAPVPEPARAPLSEPEPDAFADAVAATVAAVTARVIAEPIAEPVVEPAPIAEVVPVELAAPAADEQEHDAAFGEFWEEVEQVEARPRRGLRLVPLEAVLPMIALLIVVVVVLAWIG